MSAIHIKLEYPEIINFRRDILLLEKGLLETLVHAKNYNALRKKEFAVKNEIRKEFNGIVSLITELENIMPKEDIKKLLSEKTPKEIIRKEMKESKKETIAIDKKKREIEKQIAEIKAKLAMLE